jgi:uncharacterized protein (DUF1684 family)
LPVSFLLRLTFARQVQNENVEQMRSISFLGCSLAAAGTLAPACRKPVDPQYVGEIEKWRSERLTRLTAPYGWLSLSGLFWLRPGANLLGSGPESDIELPATKAPPQLGRIFLANGRVHLVVASPSPLLADGRPARSMDLVDDRSEHPTELALGPLRLFLIRRGPRYAIRVKDPDSQARLSFHGLEYFPIDPSWRIVARFVPFVPARPVQIPSVIGVTDTESSPGEAVFSRDGNELHLMAVSEEAGRLFFDFGDATNGKSTAGTGRFLDTPPPQDGRVILDFNQAYNPPCSFTPYATCPLPTGTNRLPIAVPAGEKRYGSH